MRRISGQYNLDDNTLHKFLESEISKDDIEKIEKNFPKILSTMQQIDATVLVKGLKELIENQTAEIDNNILMELKKYFDMFPELYDKYYVSASGIVTKEYYEKNIDKKNYYNEFAFPLDTIDQYPESRPYTNLKIKNISDASIEKLQEAKEKYNIQGIILERDFQTENGKNESITDYFSFKNYTNFLDLLKTIGVNDLNHLSLKEYELFKMAAQVYNDYKRVRLKKEEIIKLCNKFPKLQEKFYISNQYFVSKEYFENNKEEIEDFNIFDYSLENMDFMNEYRPYTNIVINNMSELPLDKIINISEKQKVHNVKIEYEYANSEVEGIKKYDSYTIDEYIEMFENMNSLLEGVNMDMPEKERFCEIYKRISKAIEYDTIAAYPKNAQEKEYSKKQKKNSRNSRNALLFRKCLCAGYADVLRNACMLYGIDVQFVAGPVDKIISKFVFEKDPKYKNFQIIEDPSLENGKIKVRDAHAWNKVKIDGVWYNFDACFDHNYNKPKLVFLSDEEIAKKHGVDKSQIVGEICEHSITQEEREAIFGKDSFLDNIKNFLNSKTKINNMFQFLKLKQSLFLSNVLSGFKNKFQNRLPELPSANSKTENQPQRPNLKDYNPWQIEDIEGYNERISKRLKDFNQNRNQNEDLTVVQDGDREDNDEIR